MNSLLHTDVIVIGAGLAGLSVASHLRDRSVTILRPAGSTPASYLARGGIAAAIGEDDSPDAHIRDTVEAGAGLVDQSVASQLARDGLDRMIDLFELSIDFDRDDDGELQLGREALHSHNRIIHAAGDETGRVVTTAVRRELRRLKDRVTFIDGRALELVVDDDRVCGVVFESDDGKVEVLLATAVVLATGGAGALFAHTTNPEGACGEGTILAARAGAVLADMEFMQFHPTALRCDERPMPLLSEAIRGAGGRLIDAEGASIMADHPQGDLAGRDVISRALWKRIRRGQEVFLDATSIADFATQFPAAFRACQARGIDPLVEPIAVIPAAHYFIGGVATDAVGRTSVDGLWAVGEVAATGAHGANRLASNSLLEAMVFGARTGADICSVARAPHCLPIARVTLLHQAWTGGLEKALIPAPILEKVGRIMWQNTGLHRCAKRLYSAQVQLEEILRNLHSHDPLRLSVECALAITLAARNRKESRGVHFRFDYPLPEITQARRNFCRQGHFFPQDIPQ